MNHAPLPERRNAAGNLEIRCPHCGVWYEERDLSAMFRHEHLSGVDGESVKDVAPGIEVDAKDREH